MPWITIYWKNPMGFKGMETCHTLHVKKLMPEWELQMGEEFGIITMVSWRNPID